MVKNISFVVRYLLFWMLFFLFERTVFVIYNWGDFASLNFADSFKLYANGAWMDISAAGYITALPLLVFVLLWIFKIKRFPVLAIKIYSWVMVVLCAAITVVNFNIYREWGTKINYRVLEFIFGSPKEAMASTGSSPWGLTVFVFLCLLAVAYAMIRFIVIYKQDNGGKLGFRIGLSLLLLGLNFLAIRGGWHLSPMNESMAYFSQQPIVNHAAVNTEWSLFHDVIDAQDNHANPFKYYSREKADSIAKMVYKAATGQPVQLLNTQAPNVVVIIMESQTANVIERLGGEKGIDPAMEQLIKEGVFFEHAYAAATRTDRGVVAVLSGFPAQGKRSIMKEGDKQAKIPSLAQNFAQHGYSTSFYYGGESQFANMTSYLLNHKYQIIVDKGDFSAKDMNSKWGAYDGAVYNRLFSDLEKQKRPFFTTMLTLTNHEPFELPGKYRFKGADVQNKFRSTAFYADSCLGDFVKRAKQTDWYKNTLFVVVADHGHRLPTADLQIYDPQHYRLPLLFFGGALKEEFRGRVIDKVCNQTDIAATLFSQLGWSHAEYSWSKDVLNPNTPDYSFYNWDDGFGLVGKDQIITFGIGERKVIYRQNNNQQAESDLTYKAKAIMQSVYQHYIDY